MATRTRRHSAIIARAACALEAVSKPVMNRRRVPLLARLAVPYRTLHCWASQQWHPNQVLKLVLVPAVCIAAITASCAAQGPATPTTDKPIVVRCAVIGGMIDTGFWQALSERFTKETGIEIDVVATGPKFVIAPAFERGEVDLITMHASDAIINLVADGFGADPQPWARNDLLIVGPADDPAKIAGSTDAVVALEKIVQAQATLLVHQSLGTNEVLHDLLAAGDLALDDEHTVVMATDRQRQLLARSAKEHAYTLVGRIPFLNGKIANDGLKIMVQGDPRLRRPYVVAVSRFNAPGSPRDLAARRLATYLRAPATQQWIAQFGRGELDDHPLFFPVVVDGPPSAGRQQVTGDRRPPAD